MHAMIDTVFFDARVQYSRNIVKQNQRNLKESHLLRYKLQNVQDLNTVNVLKDTNLTI